MVALSVNANNVAAIPPKAHYGENRRRWKRRAVHLYLEGVGFRAIGRILGVSNVSVMHWIKALGEALEPLRASRAPVSSPVIEWDEMWHFVGKKRSCGYGLLLTDTEASRLIVNLAHALPLLGDGCGSDSSPSPALTTPATVGKPTKRLSPPSMFKKIYPGQRKLSCHGTPLFGTFPSHNALLFQEYRNGTCHIEPILLQKAFRYISIMSSHEERSASVDFSCFQFNLCHQNQI